MNDIDNINYNFNESNVFWLNVAISFIMFGVALGLTTSDFKRVFTQPKQIFAGLFSQLICLPLLTLVLIHIFRPIPSVALGMILVSVCPGGNISNFMSSLAKANVALSVSLTIVTSSLSIITTPIGLAFYGSLYEPSRMLLREVSLSIPEVFTTIFFIIFLPMMIGMLVRHYASTIADKLEYVLKQLSMMIFLVIVVLGIFTNLDSFLSYIPIVLGLVAIHNLVAFSVGYSIAKLFSLDYKSTKTLTIETGIQNSGLGIALIFTFFSGLGGMLLVAAAWGVFHIISGLSIAHFFARKKVSLVTP